MVPFGLYDMDTNEIGIPMTDNDGLYTGTWIVPEGTAATSLLVEVVYISAFGHEVTEIADGMVIIQAGEGPEEPEEPEGITNLQPSENVQLMAGETMTISFNAPAGGNAYYRIMLPFSTSGDRVGTVMQEVEPGLYLAVYTADGNVVASDLQIEVIFEKGETTLAQIANGRLTLVGGMQNLPVSAVIVGDEAFDINYLNTSAYAQQKLLNWYNSGKTVYIKLSKNTLVNTNGQEVSFEALPNMLRYFDSTGIKLFSK